MATPWRRAEIKWKWQIISKSLSTCQWKVNYVTGATTSPHSLPLPQELFAFYFSELAQHMPWFDQSYNEETSVFLEQGLLLWTGQWAGLKLVVILLPQLLGHWGYRCESPWLAEGKSVSKLTRWQCWLIMCEAFGFIPSTGKQTSKQTNKTQMIWPFLSSNEPTPISNACETLPKQTSSTRRPLSSLTVARTDGFQNPVYSQQTVTVTLALQRARLFQGS